MGDVLNKSFSGCPQKEGNRDLRTHCYGHTTKEGFGDFISLRELKSPKGAIPAATPTQHSD